MTPRELRAQIENNITVPLLTAFKVYGIGETAGRKAYKRGDLPFRVVRMGNVLRVPTCDLADLLQHSAGQ